MDFMIVRCPNNPSYLDIPFPVTVVDVVVTVVVVFVVVVVVVVAKISQINPEQ